MNIAKNKKRIEKLLKFIVLPLVLLLFWLAASLLFNNKVSFSVLLYKENKAEVKIADNKVVGVFKARDNNLGLVMLRFNAFVKNSTDTLTFRIKEKDKEKWYSSNGYRAGLITNNELFPLGFPKISDSKDKTYQFELLSENNIVTIDRFGFYTGYEFSRGGISSSKPELVNFLFKKTISSFTDVDFLIASTKYMFPLVAYTFILFIFYLGKKIKRTSHLTIGFLLLLIALDVLWLEDFYIGVPLLIISLWVIALFKLKLESRLNFQVAFVLILLWVVLVLFKVDAFQDKINIWTYVFLVIGGVHAFLEEKNAKF